MNVVHTSPRRAAGLFAAAIGLVLALSACVIEIPGTGTILEPNQPPVLPRLARQTIDAGANFVLQFEVVDENPAGVVVTATSSNTALFANDRIAITASGAMRTLVAVPSAGMSGDTFITVTARDEGGLTDEMVFSLTVR